MGDKIVTENSKTEHLGIIRSSKGENAINIQKRTKLSRRTLYSLVKVSKSAKIRLRYNQVPHPTQDTNGKVTNSQFDTTNESKHKTEQKHKRSTKEVPPWNGQKNILLEGLNRFNGGPTSPLIQMWIKTHRYLVCMKDP